MITEDILVKELGGTPLDIAILQKLDARAGRTDDDVILGQNLGESILDFKFSNKLEVVFKFWQPIVESKTKGFTKQVVNSKKYELQRDKAFKGGAPKRKHKVNLYLANFEALFGEIVDKFSLLNEFEKAEILKMGEPLKYILANTTLLIADVFPKKEDNKDFKELLLETNFKEIR